MEIYLGDVENEEFYLKNIKRFGGKIIKDLK